MTLVILDNGTFVDDAFLSHYFFFLFDSNDLYVLNFVAALDVTGRPMMPHGRSQAYRVLPDPMISKQRYRKHNAFVMQVSLFKRSRNV